MKQKPRSRVNRKKAKTVLRLPDLEHAKAAVLNSLTSADAQRGYRHAIDEFVDWYCSEPRLAFNRTDVCSPVPCFRRRTGADPVPAGTCLGSNNRAIPWLQAADSVGGQ
jgi:hypothetical protein